MTHSPNRAARRSGEKVQVRIVMMCIECREVYREIPETVLVNKTLASYLQADGWYLSVLTPPGGAEVLMGPICGKCARGVHHPAVIKKADELAEKDRS